MSLNRQIFKIAMPAIAGFLGFILFDIIDIFWITKLGTDAVAGVAASGFLSWVVFSVMALTTTGGTALIAQAIGEGDQKKTYQVARETVHLSIIVAFILTILLALIGAPALRWVGLNAEAYRHGISYFRVFAWGLVGHYVFILCGQIFNAHGDTKTSVKILTGILFLNAILDPCFILGLGVFPEWGTFGAAIASLVSVGVGIILRVWFLRKRKYIDKLSTFLSFSSEYFIHIFRIGMPTATAHVSWSIVYPLLLSLVTRFGMLPLAGLTIAHRIEGFAYFTAYGFSIAMTTLVGQATGRGAHKEANDIARRGRILITLILFPMSLIFVLMPETLISAITDDPGIIAHGAQYLRIIGLSEIFLGWEMVYEGSFGGIGNTAPYMYVSVPLTLGRVPVAFLLIDQFGFGIESIWWTITISSILKGLSMGYVFKRTKPKVTPKEPLPVQPSEEYREPL